MLVERFGKKELIHAHRIARAFQLAQKHHQQEIEVARLADIFERRRHELAHYSILSTGTNTNQQRNCCGYAVSKLLSDRDFRQMRDLTAVSAQTFVNRKTPAGFLWNTLGFGPQLPLRLHTETRPQPDTRS